MSERLHRHQLDTEQSRLGARHYITPLGRLPSVTTILSGPSPRSARSAYALHRQSQGRAFHDEMHAYFDEGRPCRSPYFQSLRTFLDRMEEPQLVEGHVWHRAGFAGAVDCVAKVDGVLSVIDWKTLDDAQPSVEAVARAHRQLAAYRAAVQELYKIEVPQVYAVFVTPRREAVVHRATESAKDWLEFLRRLEEYRRRAGQELPW
jgi:ATP-dependent exoDNAse (exonuclease V) beta subunit